jgi:hypothetical protein
MDAQPDLVTCGPTCLHALYRYYGDPISLAEVVEGVTPLPTGGTLAVSLGRHALERGFRADIRTYNLQIFDPTWFAEGVDLKERLRAQAAVKFDPKLAHATEAYLAFLELGGRVRYEELQPALIRKLLRKGTPILTGLSATYLYGCARERDNAYDDVGGEATGHFVVLSGYDRKKNQVRVADPLHDNPRFGSGHYSVGMDRLLSSILLGILTYDANLLIIRPKREKK